jgi:hypothetical protein
MGRGNGTVAHLFSDPKDKIFFSREFGGRDRDRTCDLVVANDALSQLSYTPTSGNELNFSRGVGENPNGEGNGCAGGRI